MQIALPTGVTLAFDRHGTAGAPSVVFLHGLSSNRTTWRAVVDHVLARGGWQVVNVDQRGHGESGHAASVDGYDAAAYAGHGPGASRRRGAPWGDDHPVPGPGRPGGR